MKLDALRKLIREEMRTVLQEELKDILTEAVVIASAPESKIQVQQPYPKSESVQKPSFSQVMGETKELISTNDLISTGNPIFDLLNETAREGEWRSINGGYNAQDAVGFSGGMQGMNEPVVSSVEEMISKHAPVNDINNVKINSVPDFTGLMNKLKEQGKL
jgi:hypothetical protein